MKGALSTTTNDLWADFGELRARGHVEYVDGGLHIWTEDSSSESKVSEAIAKSFALRNTGVLDINATANPDNVYPLVPLPTCSSTSTTTVTSMAPSSTKRSTARTCG